MYLEKFFFRVNKFELENFHMNELQEDFQSDYAKSPLDNCKANVSATEFLSKKMEI